MSMDSPTVGELLRDMQRNGEVADWQPIGDERRETDHRGRKHPITGCTCRPCFDSALLMVS